MWRYEMTRLRQGKRDSGAPSSAVSGLINHEREGEWPTLLL
jgi:hypothetical protein